ncbi:MAG TPA: hypothetical protein VGQ62_21855 [Chloroflexota bacterium]|nr:hypothetical protein [Chloroflexota bacterium]
MSQGDTGSRRGGGLLVVLEALVVLAALLSRRPVARQRAGYSEPDPIDLSTGYEHSDIQPRVVLLAATALLVVMGLVLVAVTLFEAAVTGIPASVSRPAELIQGLGGAVAPTPPAPRLEAQSGQDMAAYRAAEAQLLSTYRWVDRQAGVVAIPIDQAMDLVVAQGLPARATPTATPRDQGSSSPSTASSGRVDEAYP